MKTQVDIRSELRSHIERKYRTQKKAAQAWGVSETLVSLVLKGQKNPSQVMLDDAGFEAVKLSPQYIKQRKMKV